MDVWEGIPGAKESKRKKGTAWIGTNRVGSAPLVEEDRARQEEGATASDKEATKVQGTTREQATKQAHRKGTARREGEE